MTDELQQKVEEIEVARVARTEAAARLAKAKAAAEDADARRDEAFELLRQCQAEYSRAFDRLKELANSIVTL